MSESAGGEEGRKRPDWAVLGGTLETMWPYNKARQKKDTPQHFCRGVSGGPDAGHANKRLTVYRYIDHRPLSDNLQGAGENFVETNKNKRNKCVETTRETRRLHKRTKENKREERAPLNERGRSKEWKTQTRGTYGRLNGC